MVRKSMKDVPPSMRYKWPYRWHSTLFGLDVVKDELEGGYVVFGIVPYHGLSALARFPTLREQNEYCRYVVLD